MTEGLSLEETLKVLHVFCLLKREGSEAPTDVLTRVSRVTRKGAVPACRARRNGTRSRG